MYALRDTAQAWNNLEHGELIQQWKFLISDNDEPVGFIPNAFVDLLHWSEYDWKRDSIRRTMRLVPRGDRIKGVEFVEACNRALLDFCEQNQDVKRFSKALKPWVTRWKAGDKDASSFHSILTPRDDLQGLGIPGVARGIFGIMTAGVHLNAYTSVEGEGSGSVDRIWVARRSQLTTYPGLLDQIVAGGMEPTDGVDPAKTLRHEAEEEAMWRRVGRGGNDNVGGGGGSSSNSHQSLPLHSDLSDAGSRALIGEVQAAGRIYFCLRKDASAGVMEEDHIEPGVRFCFDLRVREGVEPVPNATEKAIGSFVLLSVDEVVASLEARQWKPNSGLVMLDFLLRKGLVRDETCTMMQGLRRKPPLSLPEFLHSEHGLFV